MDDGSIRRVLYANAPIQQRNYVVMEVKSSLIKEERKDLYARWGGLKRTAAVMMGEPPAALKSRAQAATLAEKQKASNAEYMAKHEKAKREKQTELVRKKAENLKKKAAAAAKK